MSLYGELQKERAARQKREIASIKPRQFMLELSDADVKRLYDKAYASGITPEQLLQDFIGNLVYGTYTRGSDEVDRANSYFNRCCYHFDDEFPCSFLAWTMVSWSYDLDEVKDALRIYDYAREDLEIYAESPESARPGEIEETKEQLAEADAELRRIYDGYIADVENGDWLYTPEIQGYEEAIETVRKYLNELESMVDYGYKSYSEYRKAKET